MPCGLRPIKTVDNDPILAPPVNTGYLAHAVDDSKGWPDTQSKYFIGYMAMPAGSSLTLHFTYPHARFA